MSELLKAVLNSDEKADLQAFFSQLRAGSEQYLLRNQILQLFADYCTRHDKPAYFFHSSVLGEFLHYTHEIILEEESAWAILRPKIATQEVLKLSRDLSTFEQMPAHALLQLRDAFVNRPSPGLLEIDFRPFYAASPTIRDPRNIGNGLEFLNRYLSSQLFADPTQWLEALFAVLRDRHYNETPLLISDRLRSTAELSQQVKKALTLVGKLSDREPYENFRRPLQNLGFEPGWGNSAARVRETLELLDRLIDSPDHAVLEAFISRIPLIFRVVLISVHGWVGQNGVLGRPETTGQVVYVLNQARSIEVQLQEDFRLAGLDGVGVRPEVIVLTRLIPNCEGSSCNLAKEKIKGTENAWILRVPFREFNPEMTRNWISRFEIWPYLETFAIDAETALLDEFTGPPDLMVGNYSDGNLVAFLLARRLGATHCHIAHTLEKPRYLFSNLYWQDLEPQYHFSLQFTADLIAMNSADFILASTYQEIVGTPDNVGYYESYRCFSMPQLYHVVNGIELFSPKFNVVPPGANENLFFPYTQTSDRDPNNTQRVQDLLLLNEDPHIIGYLEEPSKRPIFAIAPLTAAKNLTGLVECFGRSPQLQECCNLTIVTSKARIEDTTNSEEKNEIERLHAYIDQYHLQGKIRWLGLRLTSPDLGEAYRVIADRGGIFVHPGRFEAFGLTLLEAMISGLPVFATQFGGPSEIIQDGENGFLINPTDLAGTAEKILQFIAQCEQDPNYWNEIGDRAIERVRGKYNWRSHTKQLFLLAKIYRFWNSASAENREALLRYLEALFYLIYKPRAEQLLEQHSQR
jgi:sucrose synthase